MAEAPWAPLDFILVLNQDAYFWQNFHVGIPRLPLRYSGRLD